MEQEKRVRVVFPHFQHRCGRRDVFVGWLAGELESEETDNTIRVGVYDDLGEAYVVSLGDPLNENPFAGTPTHFVGGVPQFHLPFGFEYVGKVDRITGSQTDIENRVTKAVRDEHQLVIHGEDRDYFWNGPKELIASIKVVPWMLSQTGQAFTADLEESQGNILAPIFLRDFVLYRSTRTRLMKQLKRLIQTKPPLNSPIN